MTPSVSDDTLELAARRTNWLAIYALTLCVGTLIASEFLPVSLLTPIAADLRLTEGLAGQAIAVSGVFAVLASLSIAPLTRGLDRRTLMLVLTVVMLLSGVVVSLAANYPMLMVGRALLGLVIGGFWSMSTSAAMRLSSKEDTPKAIALLNGGNALATTIAAPIGSFLGQYIGWRGAFFAVVPLAALTLVWQFRSLPSLPSEREARASALGLLRRGPVRIGVAAITLLFMGQFGLFTYLRPFLETVTQVSVTELSGMLLVMGLAGTLGSWLIGRLVGRWMGVLIVVMPATLGALAFGLVAFGHNAPATWALLAAWGLVGTSAPVAWGVWISRTLADDAEAGGGLMVAAIQMAITLGAAFGGLLFDRQGWTTTFSASACILFGGALLAWVSHRAVRAGS